MATDFLARIGVLSSAALADLLQTVVPNASLSVERAAPRVCQALRTAALVGAAPLAVVLYCLRRRALPALRCGTPRAFFSRFSQGSSAKTVCTIRRARSDTGKITEKCS